MDPILGGALIGGAASLIGGFLNRDAAASSSSQNQASAREQMTFQKEMSDTSYQRSMKDMKLAGLNPMLAYQQGGASSPGGASAAAVTPDMSDAAGGLAASARDAINQKRERALMDSQVSLQEAQAKAAKSAAMQSAASARAANANANIAEAELPAAQSQSRLETKRNAIDEKMLITDAALNRIGQAVGIGASATSLGRFLKPGAPRPSGEPGKIVPALKSKDPTRPHTMHRDGDPMGTTPGGRKFNKRTGEMYD